MYVENFYGELINHMKDKGIDENQFLDILLSMSEKSPDKNLDDILIELFGDEYEIESLVIVDKIIDKFINRLPEKAPNTNLPDTKKIIDKNVNVTPVRAPKEIDNDIKKIK